MISLGFFPPFKNDILVDFMPIQITAKYPVIRLHIHGIKLEEGT